MYQMTLHKIYNPITGQNLEIEIDHDVKKTKEEVLQSLVVRTGNVSKVDDVTLREEYEDNEQTQ